MTSSLKIAFASFLVTAAAVKAVPAFAEPLQPPANVAVVHIADLDLSTDAGRRQLDRRIVTAAGEVCGVASDADLAGQNAELQCRKDVLAAARARADLLAAAHVGRAIVLAARR